MEAPEGRDAILSRIHQALDNIKEIHKITGVPSVSVGVLHNGESIFCESFGVRDAEMKKPANSDTLYHLASVSKNFLSALAGIAVSEGKLDWKAPVSTYLPDFNPLDDSEVGNKARILDCLRHSTGVGNMDQFVHGPRNSIITKEKDMIQLLNQCPIKDQKGERCYNTWNYSNWGYTLVALCLQKVYDMRYHEILRQKILVPLELNRTFLCRDEINNDDNVAPATIIMEDGSIVQQAFWATNEEHTPTLAALGILSSVNDMLKWAKAILAAEKVERETLQGHSPAYPRWNPLRNISAIRGKAYWSRPARDRFNNDTHYCLGWLRVILPSSNLISMGLNSTSSAKPLDEGFIIGRESPKTEVILHNGGVMGSISVFYTLPQTNSAIIVFANGSQSACAAEPTAQLLLQALLDLKPHVDLLPFVRSEMKEGVAKHYRKASQNWHKHRDVSLKEAPISEFIGCYQAHTLSLSIEPEELDNTEKYLTITFGGENNTKRRLEYYGKDAYSCFPLTQDEWLSEELCHWKWEAGIFRFQRDSKGKVRSLVWKFDEGEYPAEFHKL